VLYQDLWAFHAWMRYMGASGYGQTGQIWHRGQQLLSHIPSRDDQLLNELREWLVVAADKPFYPANDPWSSLAFSKAVSTALTRRRCSFRVFSRVSPAALTTASALWKMDPYQ
jgi:hypothetical protein